jgi:hypothetical protein
MPEDLIAKALKRHAAIWSAYRDTVSSSPIETHPLAFVVRARNEVGANRIADALRSANCEVVEVDKKLWPPTRRWKIIAKTGRMPISEEIVESWVRNTASMLAQLDGDLVLYAPVEPV